MKAMGTTMDKMMMVMITMMIAPPTSSTGLFIHSSIHSIISEPSDSWTAVDSIVGFYPPHSKDDDPPEGRSHGNRWLDDTTPHKMDRGEFSCRSPCGKMDGWMNGWMDG